MTFFRINENWRSLTHDPSARGVYLVIVSGAGSSYFLSTKTVEVRDVSGKLVLFTGAIINKPSFKETINVYSRTYDSTSLKFAVDLGALPLDDLRRQGVMLELLDVDVYWAIVGQTDRALDQAYHLISGTVDSPVVDFDAGKATFGVEDRIIELLENDRPFPPFAVDDTRLTSLNTEQFGKVYPVVFGEVDKVPVIENSSGAGADFAVAVDLIGDLSSVVRNMYVKDGADIYAGAGASQAKATDGEGDKYWSATPDTAAGSDRDVVADLSGHASTSPGEIIRDLISFYSVNGDVIDIGSIENMISVFNNLTMGIAFNSRVDGGVFRVIRDRIAKVVPFVTEQRAGRIKFVPLTWNLDVSKALSTDTNILRKAAPASETSKRDVYNAFVAKFDRSGTRNDSQGVVVRDHENNYQCLMSKNMVGRRPMRDLDLGDLKDQGSVLYVVEWLIETHTKVRTKVSYECTADAVDVELWDTVKVYDEDEGWDHWPRFKVVGKTYSDGSGVVLDLISLGSYVDVYNVNRYN